MLQVFRLHASDAITMYAQLLTRSSTGVASVNTAFQLGDQIFLLAAIVGTEDNLLGGHLAIVGDVKEVAVFLEQSPLPLVDSQPLAKHDHPITLSASDRLVPKLGDSLLE